MPEAPEVSEVETPDVPHVDEEVGPGAVACAVCGNVTDDPRCPVCGNVPTLDTTKTDLERAVLQ